MTVPEELLQLMRELESERVRKWSFYYTTPSFAQWVQLKLKLRVEDLRDLPNPNYTELWTVYAQDLKEYYDRL